MHDVFQQFGVNSVLLEKSRSLGILKMPPASYLKLLCESVGESLSIILKVTVT